MAIDLTIYLDDQPGELARLGEVLGRGGVNIDGFCAVTSGGGRAEVHVLVEDATAAFTELTAASIGIGIEQEVAVVDVEDRPGVLGEMSPKLGEAGATSPWPTWPPGRVSCSPPTIWPGPRPRWSIERHAAAHAYSAGPPQEVALTQLHPESVEGL